MAEINHVGIYVADLEAAKAFFEKYFGARAGDRYHNPKKEFSSYMLSLGNGARLEIMSRPGLRKLDGCSTSYGYAHVSVSVGSKAGVDEATRKLVADGYECIDGPRTTGDGYYESAVLDAEGNVIEITV